MASIVKMLCDKGSIKPPEFKQFKLYGKACYGN